MATHIFSVLCKAAVIDRFSNGLTLFEVIEGITVETSDRKELDEAAATGKPLSAPGFRAVFVSLWRRDVDDVPEEAEIRVLVRAPRGNEFKTPEQTVDLVSANGSRQLMHLEQFPLLGSGTYTFEVQLNRQDTWESVGSYPVQVTISVADAEAARVLLATSG
jgi:hypothetical protein